MPSTIVARQIGVSGKVQGVGFRPFVYRLAKANDLQGWVKNRMGNVDIYIQGAAENIEKFLAELLQKKPPLAEPHIESNHPADISPVSQFSILDSEPSAQNNIHLPADLFLCDECLKELNDPANRRYQYPFINCTQCGPRYTLIQSLPYDRENTTMADFELCADCQAEYENPQDRRFHAEPIACEKCGPALSFKNNVTECIDDNQQSLFHALNTLRAGKVLAVKGIGGYHLMCDAKDTQAVLRLRQHKSRPDKPLAIMLPAQAQTEGSVVDWFPALSEMQTAFLSQAARPVLLVNKTVSSELSSAISPGLNETGIMLPYSPLHHLLLNAFHQPLVATSANISGEPVLIDNEDVEKRLAQIADAFLHHNRPVARPADDSVHRIIAGKPRPLRLGRGLAPLELNLPFELTEPVLAVGGQMKNTVTLAWGKRAVISPHIGEMHSARSLQVFEQSLNDLQNLYGVKAKQIICDAHPAYTTRRWAHRQSCPVHQVYHHYAHASAAYYETAYYETSSNENITVFSWDGTGYGVDETLWGGEALFGQPGNWKRVASLQNFTLPGGDKVGREPWRSAAACCWQIERELPEHLLQGLTDSVEIVKQAWQKKLNSPESSSVGRLFDAAAALCGVRTHCSYEGQAAMEFEALCETLDAYIKLPLLKQQGIYVADWKPLIENMLDTSISVSQRATVFHHSLAHTLLQQARMIRQDYGSHIVSFSGGVFQNKVLTQAAIDLLEADGFKVYLAQNIPLNDAGISFGQVIEYAGLKAAEKIEHECV